MFANDNVVTLQEWEEAVNAEGAKYGIEVESYYVLPGHELTKDAIDESVAMIREIGQNNMKKRIDAMNRIVVNAALEEQNSVYAMPYVNSIRHIFPVVFDTELDLSYYSFTLALEADVTVDLQNDYIISVANEDVYIYNYVGLTTAEITAVDITYVKNSSSYGYT